MDLEDLPETMDPIAVALKLSQLRRFQVDETFQRLENFRVCHFSSHTLRRTAFFGKTSSNRLQVQGKEASGGWGGPGQIQVADCGNGSCSGCCKFYATISGIPNQWISTLQIPMPMPKCSSNVKVPGGTSWKQRIRSQSLSKLSRSQRCRIDK